MGEQYLDLEPATASGPYLQPGNVIPESQTTIPVSDAVILENLNKLLGSVDTQHLSTVINQLGMGFNDLGPSLQQLIDNGNALTRSAIAALPQTLTLINDGRTVLDTQRDVSGELKSFAHSFALLTGQLRTSDGSLRGVLDNGVLASKQLRTLLSANEPVLPVLLDNLNTFTGIQAVRLPYVRAVLELYPAITADAFYALPPPKNGVSFARFGLVTDNGPFCSQGYSTSVRRGNTAGDWGGAADLDNYCTASTAAGRGRAGRAARPRVERRRCERHERRPVPRAEVPRSVPRFRCHVAPTGRRRPGRARRARARALRPGRPPSPGSSRRTSPRRERSPARTARSTCSDSTVRSLRPSVPTPTSGCSSRLPCAEPAEDTMSVSDPPVHPGPRHAAWWSPPSW